tara:strand:+ start:1455 stop:6146 length:4692 start_codon:yes stop_codon:yes gene_type:complete
MRTAQASTLIMLLLLASLSAVMQPANAADTTVNTETTWSGEIVLTGNVTVANGTTLTIAPGTTIDAGEDHWIRIEGSLIASDTTLSSSATPLTQGSHGAGLWVGIQIESNGHAQLSNVTINNSKTAVRNHGNLVATTLHINDAYIGLSNSGTASLADLTAQDIDYDVVRTSGSLNVEVATFTNVAGGIVSSGTSDVSDLSFYQTGLALKATSGHLQASGVSFNGVTVGIASQAGAVASVASVIGTNVALVVDAADSDDLTLDTMVISGHRLLLANGATHLQAEDITFVGNLNETRAVLDQRCNGICTWNQTTLTNTVWGVALSGDGDHTFNDLTSESTLRNIDASGNGNLLMSNATLHGSDAALSLRGPSSIIDGASITSLSSSAIALDVLDGHHDWNDVSVSKTYSSQDTTSIGLKAWYSTIVAEGLSIANHGHGIQLSNTNLDGNTMTVVDGKSTGILLEDSHLDVGSLTTQVFPTGALLEGASTLQASNWDANLHGTPLMVGSESTATVRDFQPQNTQTTSSDALGDGYLLYGGSTSATIATSSSDFLEETPVTFTDLTGSPIEASITVHGFTLQSNSNGAATLPLKSQGSVVDVSLGGAGVRVTLYGATMGQSVQVPVIPQGDWTITSGQFVYLGARPDGSPHMIDGDLTLETGSGLQLAHTAVILPDGAVNVQGSAQLLGDGSTMTAQSFTMGFDSVLSSGSADGFTVNGNVSWACQTLRTSERVDINGNLMLQPGCEFDLVAGSVSGSVTALTGAELNILSELNIRVLDQGDPVEGAVISVDGAVASTDAQGRLSTTATARQVTDSSETIGGIKNINLQIGSFTDFVTWDSTTSFDHTFMASRISSGTLDEWLVLESQWSPYFLDSDLIVGQSGTLSLDDGVSLRISEGHTITVEGTMNAGDATLSSTGQGARWGGLHLGSLTSSTIDLSATSLLEASPAVTVSHYGQLTATGSEFARSSGADPLIVISSGSNASIELISSALYDAGSGCINSFATAGHLVLSDVSVSNCNGVGVWARQTHLDVDGLTLSGDMTHGFELTAVTGSMNNIDASEFTGTGYIGWLESIDGSFAVSDLNGTVGGMGGLAGINNRFIDLSEIQVTGAPAIDFDETAGIISGLILNGQGAGTAFASHHGRTMDALIVEQMIAANYAVAIDLHADIEDGSVAPIVFRSPDILSSVALSADHYSARIEGGSIIGEVAASGDIQVNLVDVVAEQTSAFDDAVIIMWTTFNFDAQVNSMPIAVLFEIDTIGHDPEHSSQSEGTSVLVEIPTSVAVETSTTILASMDITATATGLPVQVMTVNYTAGMNTTIIVPMTLNGAPLVEITAPYPGQRAMETTPLNAQVSYSDDLDATQDLVVEWIITDATGSEVMRGPNEPEYNITDLPYGFYVLEAKVTDALGATSSDTVDFEITQLDTDGDWTNSCTYTQQTDVWFNAEIGYPCGPDQEDTDDDNDGVPDARDDYPMDACAFLDTDGDGQPDDVNCPDGMTTWLFADQDDDNDGIPDVMEGTPVDEPGDFSTSTLLLIALVVAAILLFAARMRKGGGDDLGELDLTHL